MGSGKWIGGFLGWVAGGPIGALLGYFLGSAVEKFIDAARQLPGGSAGSGQGGFGGGFGTGGYGGSTGSGGYGTGTGGYGTGAGGYGGAYTGRTGGSYQQQTGGYRTSTGGRYTADEQRNSFFVSLLVLSSAVMKADGQVLASERDCAREFIRKNFGESAVDEAMRMLDSFNRQQVNIYSVGDQIASNMNYSQRLQLFHYLVQIATSDGNFSKSEKSVLEAIGAVIRLQNSDINSVIAMFYRENDESAYAVLGISPNATDDEVKSAYRRMAMKNHPDKVSTLGPEVQKAAEEKFRQVQEAYETIKRQRGMS